MKNNCEIAVTKHNLKPLVYFIMSMFQQENGHMQGTSNKSDILGGYIDRWINKLPENLIFNNYLLKDKNYKAIVDYFIYGPESDKNAPDVLGLKCTECVIPRYNIIKFAEFNETTWEMCEGMPYIEVKTFKKNQKMVAVRDAQMDDDTYYVFVESNIAPDYLTSLLSFDSINEGLLNEIEMDNTFIKSNTRNILMQPVKVKQVPDSKIGTLKLLSIIKGSDYKNGSILCDEKEDAYYLNGIEEVGKIPMLASYEKNVPKELLNCTFNEYFEKNNNRMYDKKIISLKINKPENVIIKKVNKSSIYVNCIEDCKVYTFELKKDKMYRLNIELFERNSKWREYITYKNQFIDEEDRTNELVEKFDIIYSEFMKKRYENNMKRNIETMQMMDNICNKK